MKPFRAYDIRGIYGEDITPELAYKVGLSLRSIVPGEIAIGRDSRPSGEPLKAALASGILASGCNVYDLGMAPTPALYFSVVHHGLSGGVVVTASHNPPEYNGFKVVGKRALSLSYETGLSEMEALISSGRLPTVDWGNVGTYRELEWREEYLEALLKDIEIERKLRVVVDIGNGVGGVIEEAFRRLDADVKCLFKEPDGRFPHHIPDPLREEALDVLRREVVKEGADIGVALDGDCDRVGFVDERGRVVGGDAATMIFARDVLSRSPGSELIVNVLASKAASDYISKLGGRVRMVRVGHSYIMSELMSSGAMMAGELSGHFYFSDRYLAFDDGIYAALRMAEITSKSALKLSEIADSLPSYFTSPEFRVRCEDELKPLVMRALKKEVSKLNFRTINIDGIRLEADDGWAIVRPSNTEPALVLRFEGTTPLSLQRIKGEVIEALRRASFEAGYHLDLTNLMH